MAKNEFIQNKEKIDQCAARMEAAAAAELKRIKTEDPEFGNQYTMIAKVQGFKKRAPGFDKVSPRIVELMLNRGGLDRKQAEIVKAIVPEFPQHKIIPAIWQRELMPWEKKKIVALIKDRMGNKINIAKSKTLSDIRKQLIANRNEESASRILKATISVTKEAITINGKTTYPVEPRKSGEYEYPSIRVSIGKKRQWLRVDLLLELLG